MNNVLFVFVALVVITYRPTSASSIPCVSTTNKVNGTCDIVCNARTQDYDAHTFECRASTPYCCTNLNQSSYRNVSCTKHTITEVSDIFLRRADDPIPWFNLFYCCEPMWLRGVIIPPPLSLMVVKSAVSTMITMLTAVVTFYVLRLVRYFLLGPKGSYGARNPEFTLAKQQTDNIANTLKANASQKK
eukprot:PhF_6_TR42687/c0_g2_i6/m.64402